VAAGLGLESVCESCARTKKGDDRTVDASSVHKLVVTFSLGIKAGALSLYSHTLKYTRYPVLVTSLLKQ
jgi:hypothetical protein